MIVDLTQGLAGVKMALMRVLSAVRRRIFLRLLRWAIVLRSHPLRRALAVSVAVFVAVAIIGWQHLHVVIPIWTSRFVNYVLRASQTHPHLARVLDVVLDAVPDAVPLFLGIAGLVYLMPDLARKIESSKPLRAALAALFILFSIFAIVVNAINRGDQKHDREMDETRIGTVEDTNNQILKLVLRPSPDTSESARRKRIEDVLRNQYILSHNRLDPGIVDGSKMPPDDWMNQKLAQLGEKWTVVSPQPTLIASAPPQSPKAVVVFGFYNPDIVQQPVKKVEFADMQTDTLSFSIGAFVRGDVPARNLQVWIRRCTSCEWVGPPPAGWSASDADHPYDRVMMFPVPFLPNVGSPKWDFVIRVPRYAKFSAVGLSAFYACDNCPTVNWKAPQHLIETNNIHDYLSLQLPSTPDTPEPVKQ